MLLCECDSLVNFFLQKMADDIELAGLSEAELAELAEFIDTDVRGGGREGRGRKGGKGEE